MARIVRFTDMGSQERSSTHTEVECGYRVLGIGGQTVLQLDTYGSDERQIPGKVSQSIQIDREAAEELIQLLRGAFPGLR